MDIKRMHNMIEKLSECAESEFDKGIENVDACEMGKVTDMLKDLAEAMYYRALTKAMDEADNDDMMEMFDRYGDRRFYDDYRYKTSGRYAPKGRGTYVGRRGYEEPYYHMTPDMMREHTPEYWRDIDRASGKMYYTESGNEHMTGAATRDMREGRSGISRRSYMETKELHRANTPEDKQEKMKSLENYAKELTEDVTGMIADMTPEEKNLLRSKVQTLAQKIV